MPRQTLGLRLVNRPFPDGVEFSFSVDESPAAEPLVMSLEDLCVGGLEDFNSSGRDPSLVKSGAGVCSILGDNGRNFAKWMKELEGKLADGWPLWLEFLMPSGGLPLLDWEGLLDPLVDSPLFRASPERLPSAAWSAPEEEVNVAICGSMPVAKSMFDMDRILFEVLRAVHDVEPRARCHVFLDESNRFHQGGGVTRRCSREWGWREWR